MKSISILLPYILLMGIVGCSGTRNTVSVQPEAITLLDGETAFLEKDYQEALRICEELLSDPSGKEDPERGRIYELAGNAAFELEQFDKSQVYLETARRMNTTSELSCLNLISIFNRFGNVPREITFLETYMEDYPSGKELETVRERLFQTYRESSDYNLAVDLWPSLDEQTRTDPSNLEFYLEANRSLNNDSICDVTAERILEQNPENEPALTWLARKYYWQAENRYQAEMGTYNQNKTQKQYAILVAALKQVTVDFKESLRYFSRLYKLDPDTEYARYLANIYARLGDEESARHYRGLVR